MHLWLGLRTNGETWRAASPGCRPRSQNEAGRSSANQERQWTLDLGKSVDPANDSPGETKCSGENPRPFEKLFSDVNGYPTIRICREFPDTVSKRLDPRSLPAELFEASNRRWGIVTLPTPGGRICPDCQIGWLKQTRKHRQRYSVVKGFPADTVQVFVHTSQKPSPGQIPLQPFRAELYCPPGFSANFP